MEGGREKGGGRKGGREREGRDVHTTHCCLYSGGQMEDIVASVALSPRQVLRVFFQTCLAVAHMHSQNPPIIHRDLKVCGMNVAPSAHHVCFLGKYMYMYFPPSPCQLCTTG